MSEAGPPCSAHCSARGAAEQAARAQYGRLLARLARRARDLAAAEDALAEAFSLALEHWPKKGVPESPEAWLLTVARRQLGQAGRHGAVREAAAPALAWLGEAAAERADGPEGDRRLELLFACAHPAIAPADRAPLMLQTVLGLDAARIAAAFLDSPAAMAQRLVRAKQRIREQGLRFDLPERGEWPARLGAVLAAVYAAFGAGCADIAGADPNHQGLAGEGLFLARLLAELLPKEPEALGLAALALTVAARRPAGRDAAGRFVPLSRQDPGLWLAPLLAEAEALLAAAARFGRPGRYQLEAAIHAAHAARPRLGHTPWPAIRLLYGALVAVSPTAGALVGQAAALAECEGPAAGLAALASLPSAELAGYQPYHALRAHLLARQGQAEAAAQARQQALGLTVDPAVRAFLLGSAGQGEPTPATAR